MDMEKIFKETLENIWKEICSDNVLGHYDLELTIILAIKAHPVGLGEVISNKLPNVS